MKTYPEINGLSLAEVNEALNLARVNLDALTPEARKDTESRIAALEDRRRRLTATGVSIRAVNVALRMNGIRPAGDMR